MEESVVFIFPYQTNGNHAMELPRVSQSQNNGIGLLISLKL